MAHREELYCGISYIVAGVLAFLGTMTPLLDMRNRSPDIYLDLSTLYLLWIPALIISALGLISIRRKGKVLFSILFIVTALPGAVLTISSIATRVASIYRGQGSQDLSWTLGTGGTMLLAAFLWATCFPAYRIIQRIRARTLEKRIMASLLGPPVGPPAGKDAYWEHQGSQRGIESSAILPQ